MDKFISSLTFLLYLEAKKDKLHHYHSDLMQQYLQVSTDPQTYHVNNILKPPKKGKNAHFWRDMRFAQNMYDESNKYFKDGDGGSLMKVFWKVGFA